MQSLLTDRVSKQSLFRKARTMNPPRTSKKNIFKSANTNYTTSYRRKHRSALGHMTTCTVCNDKTKIYIKHCCLQYLLSFILYAGE